MGLTGGATVCRVGVAAAGLGLIVALVDCGAVPDCEGDAATAAGGGVLDAQPPITKTVAARDAADANAPVDLLFTIFSGSWVKDYIGFVQIYLPEMLLASLRRQFIPLASRRAMAPHIAGAAMRWRAGSSTLTLVKVIAAVHH